MQHLQHQLWTLLLLQLRNNNWIGNNIVTQNLVSVQSKY